MRIRALSGDRIVSTASKLSANAEARRRFRGKVDFRRYGALVLALLPGGLPLLGGYALTGWVIGRIRQRETPVRMLPRVLNRAQWTRRLRRLAAYLDTLD